EKESWNESSGLTDNSPQRPCEHSCFVRAFCLSSAGAASFLAKPRGDLETRARKTYSPFSVFIVESGRRPFVLPVIPARFLHCRVSKRPGWFSHAARYSLYSSS